MRTTAKLLLSYESIKRKKQFHSPLSQWLVTHSIQIAAKRVKYLMDFHFPRADCDSLSLTGLFSNRLSYLKTLHKVKEDGAVQKAKTKLA